MPLKPNLSAAVALLAVAWTNSAQAATLCSVAGGNLVFGSFSPITGLYASAEPDHDATADIFITCSSDPGTQIGVEVQLDGGHSGNPLERRLAGPGVLVYNIYSDSAYSSLWGDGASGSGRPATLTIADGQSSASITLAAYGRIPRGQRSAAVGSYSDTVLLTVVY